MIIKKIIFFGQAAAVGCDEKCHKVWGMSNRPKKQLSDNPDDWEYLPDIHLPDAAPPPETYEGGCGKPERDEDKLNKWCVRECERCTMTNPDGEMVKIIDLSKPVRNIKQKDL